VDVHVPARPSNATRPPLHLQHEHPELGMQQQEVRLPLAHPAVERVPGLAVVDAVVVGEGPEGEEGLGLAAMGGGRER